MSHPIPWMDYEYCEKHPESLADCVLDTNHGKKQVCAKCASDWWAGVDSAIRRDKGKWHSYNPSADYKRIGSDLYFNTTAGWRKENGPREI